MFWIPPTVFWPLLMYKPHLWMGGKSQSLSTVKSRSWDFGQSGERLEISIKSSSEVLKIQILAWTTNREENTEVKQAKQNIKLQGSKKFMSRDWGAGSNYSLSMGAAVCFLLGTRSENRDPDCPLSQCVCEVVGVTATELGASNYSCTERAWDTDQQDQTKGTSSRLKGGKVLILEGPIPS